VKIGFDVFDYGVIKRRVSEGRTEEDDDWKHGHPIMFPHALFVGSQFSATLQFRVPVDQTHTYHVSLYTYCAAPGAEAPKQTRIPYRFVPLKHAEGDWVLDYTFNQDYMAWVTQGPIAQRDKEKLGESDRGIILFRRMLKEEMQKLERGETPMNVFPTGATTTEPLHLPLERVKLQMAKRPQYRPGEAGYSADADLIQATLATWDAPIAAERALVNA
jgi:5,5'-dehydrodivanillate O-demethylase